MMLIPIVQLITDLSTGGTQTALLRLLSRLDRNRFDPTVCCLLNSDTPVAQKIRDLDIRVVDLGLTGATRIDALWRLYRLLDRIRPIILHSWLFHAVLLARLVGRSAGVPLIVSARRNIDLGSPFRERINRMTASTDDCAVAVSAAARRVEIECGGATSDSVVTIYNGVDLHDIKLATAENAAALRAELELSSGARLVGTIGRLHPEKETDLLLRAAPLVIERAPDTVFLIVGDGPARTELQALARNTGINENVRFLGERRDVPFILGGLDLFVLCSPGEGMSNALLEAMATGLPAVATAVGGTPEVVVQGKTGILVPPGNTAAMSNAILSMLSDPERGRTMGRAGRERMESLFNIDTTVRQTEALYDKLLIGKFALRQAEEDGAKIFSSMY